MKKVFVLGSINMDYCINTSRLPLLGESKEGHDFFINQGGKGANQAIACKKLGVDSVYLLCAVGNDDEGKKLKNIIDAYIINTEGFQVVDNINTGACIICFDETKKDNVLVIDKGANNYIDFNNVKEFLSANASQGDILITQLEVNLDTMGKTVKLAKELGMYVILNPAPVTKINNDIYKYIDLIIPNETEANLLSNIKIDSEADIKKLYTYFNNLGVKELILTFGANGSYYVTEKEFIHQDIFKVEVVDTTSAGDTFIGAIASKLASGKEIKDALPFAAKCSSITVSRKGAGRSIPTLDEIEN